METKSGFDLALSVVRLGIWQLISVFFSDILGEFQVLTIFN
jgi:hypothetical protein